jgi:L,D-transpeptidase catalytic domain
MLAVLFLLACGGGARPVEPIVFAPITMTIVKAAPATPIAIAKRRPYRIGIESVEILRTVAVRKEPNSDAAILGIITKGTHAGVIDAVAAGSECGRWIAIAPRGWVCENAVEPSEAAPTPATEATFDDDGQVPNLGVYGLVRGANATAYASGSDVLADAGRALAGSNTVRAVGVAVVDGRRFWRTTQGQLIDEASIVQLSPSRWKGVAIADPKAMPAWVRLGKPIKTYATPSLRGTVDGELAPRMVVTILEESDGGFVRVGDTAWVERRALRVATVAKPPEGTGSDEKWFDIDRDEQVLVAYEGERPVYATLVSTGKYQHETPTSVARIASKLEHAVMTSDKETVYSVADVPWTMYYDRDFALHTSYWHDGFGSPRSHGCVNLAPRDARILYRWSSPDVPPGWTAVYGDEDHPGSLVRVRSVRDPEPSFRGYARTMHDKASTVAAR